MCKISLTLNRTVDYYECAIIHLHTHLHTHIHVHMLIQVLHSHCRLLLVKGPLVIILFAFPLGLSSDVSATRTLHSLRRAFHSSPKCIIKNYKHINTCQLKSQTYMSRLLSPTETPKGSPELLFPFWSMAVSKVVKIPLLMHGYSAGRLSGVNMWMQQVRLLKERALMLHNNFHRDTH